jgi:hypothetical protein
MPGDCNISIKGEPFDSSARHARAVHPKSGPSISHLKLKLGGWAANLRLPNADSLHSPEVLDGMDQLRLLSAADSPVDD